MPLEGEERCHLRNPLRGCRASPSRETSRPDYVEDSGSARPSAIPDHPKIAAEPDEEGLKQLLPLVVPERLGSVSTDSSTVHHDPATQLVPEPRYGNAETVFAEIMEFFFLFSYGVAIDEQ